MKDKIILFVIGVLVGAVIATGAFYAYTVAAKSCDCNSNNQMNGGQPPEMSSGQNGGGQPPEKPSDDNTQNSNQNNNS